MTMTNMIKAVVSVVACLTTLPVVLVQGQGWSGWSVGDSVCVEGYVMDYYCIERGTLFDNPTVSTLGPEGPLVHSVHCLIDVPQCVASSFEILLPSEDSWDDGFIRGWRLDDETKDQAIAIAKSTGVCGDCDGTGTLERGFHIGMTATIVDMGNAGVPPTIRAVSWGQSDMRATDPTSTTGGWRFCPDGSDYPPAGVVTDFPTAAPTTKAPTAAPSVPAVVVEDEAVAADPEASLAGAEVLTNLAEGLVLRSTINGDNTVTFTLAYDGEGWVALAVSPDGQMVGSKAVIGIPGGGTPQIYDLNGKTNDAVVPSDTQILVESDVSQFGGVTMLVFTVPLETDGFYVSTEGDNSFLYAYGSSNDLGYHAARSAFSASLVPQAPEAVADGSKSLMLLEDGLSLTTVDNGDGTASFTLEYQGEAWVSLAVSPDGLMVGAKAVIGLPESGTDPQIYDLNSRSTAGVVPADTQILTSSSITQENGVTTLSFTVPLETDGFSVSPDENGFLYAYGSSNDLGFHATRSAFSASLAAGGEGGVVVGDAAQEEELGVGSKVCIEGYLMDFFCISRGTLFDNPSVVTLSADGPVVHSVHCLLDVPQCIASPFEILLPDDKGTEFIRGWQLDDETKNSAVAAAKAAGKCDDCTGTQTNGMYISFEAEIMALGRADGTPPVVKALGDVVVSSPDDLSCPLGSAYPPALVDNEEPEVDGVLQLVDGILTLETVDNGDNTASFTLTYQGEAWISLAVSPDGQMVGAQAVIGLPDSGSDPEIYDLTARSVDGVVPAGTQILSESSVTQENGVTTLTFTVPLETEGFFVSSEGENGFLYAYGTSNELGFHAARSAFVANLAGEAALAEDTSTLFAVHGWLMGIAWGLLIPMGIGGSLVRDLLPGPPGLWFTIHRTCNSLAVLFTIIAFALAVAGIQKGGSAHFSVSPHRAIGLVVFILAVVQAVNGIMRPHLPHEPDEKKSSARKTWEPVHRFGGLIILALAWYNCDSGIKLFQQIFGVNTSAFTAAFWIIAAVLFGGAVIGFVYVRSTKKEKENAGTTQPAESAADENDPLKANESALSL